MGVVRRPRLGGFELPRAAGARLALTVPPLPGSLLLWRWVRCRGRPRALVRRPPAACPSPWSPPALRAALGGGGGLRVSRSRRARYGVSSSPVWPSWLCGRPRLPLPLVAGAADAVGLFALLLRVRSPQRHSPHVAALAGGGSRSPAAPPLFGESGWWPRLVGSPPAPPPSFFVGWRVVLAVSARRGFPHGAVAHGFPRVAASFCPLAVVLLRGLMPPAPPSVGGGLSRPALPRSPSWAVFFIVLFAGTVRGAFLRRGAPRPDARV